MLRYRHLTEDALDELRVGDQLDILYYYYYEHTIGNRIFNHNNYYEPITENGERFISYNLSSIFYGKRIDTLPTLVSRSKRTLTFNDGTRSVKTRYADFISSGGRSSSYYIVKNIPVIDYDGDDDDCL